MKRLSFQTLAIVCTLLTSGISLASSMLPCPEGTTVEGSVQLTKTKESSCEFWVLPLKLRSGGNIVPSGGMCAKVETVDSSLSLEANQNYRLSICASLNENDSQLLIRVADPI